MKTPYPYFGLLLAAFVLWAIAPRQTRADYSKLKWSLELDRKIDLPEDGQFQQALSLVVENRGDSIIHDIPIELSATIEPQKSAEILAGFLGRKLLILTRGRSLPLVVVLSDPINPGAKRRYFIEGGIQAEPPFKVTYEIREEGEDAVLASYVVDR